MDKWEGLTRGTMRGTCGSRRKFFAFEKTAKSAARNASSKCNMSEYLLPRCKDLSSYKENRFPAKKKQYQVIK